MAGSGPRAPQRASAIVLIAFGLLVGALLAEGLLRAYVAVVDTPRLDRRGFRNAAAPAHADIVAIGDSMTYGYNVPAADAWPQQLGRLLHRSIYQMAVGGWGPGNYYQVSGLALSLRPKALIVAYYLGNDLSDAYALIYHRANFAGTPPSADLDVFASRDPRVRSAMDRAEAVDPSFARWGAYSCEETARTTAAKPTMTRIGELMAAPATGGAGPGVSPSAAGAAGSPSIRRRLSGALATSLLYRETRIAIDRVRNVIVSRRVGEGDYGPPICVHVNGPRVRSVLAVGQRLVLLDRDDPRVIDGERISMAIFRQMADASRRAGTRFYVALIPSKETVLREAAERTGADTGNPYLRAVWQGEADARAHALAFFAGKKIAAIDTLPGLQAVVAAGVNPYLPTAETHPIAPGYRAIAETIARRLQRDEVASRP